MIESNNAIPSKQPNCLKCIFFKVTWDPVYPRSCDVFGIKTSNMPSQSVYKATGANCPSFLLKKGLK